MTSKEDQALAFITEYIAREGRSPAMGDIAGALCVSDTRAKALVSKLAAKELLERTPQSQRATMPGER